MPAIISAPVLKEVVEALTAIVDEAKFRISAEGLKVSAVDQANVAMVSLELGKGAFESYDLDEGQIALGLKKFHDALSGAAGEDKVELNINEDLRKLELRNGPYFYRLSLLDPSSVRKEPKIPKDFPLTAIVTLNGALLKNIVRESSKVCDKVWLQARDKTFTAEAPGDLDSFMAEFPETLLIGFEASADARTCFSIDYIEDVVKVLGRCERVSIQLGTDYPGIFSADIAGGNGTVKYLVAPLIESEG